MGLASVDQQSDLHVESFGLSTARENLFRLVLIRTIVTVVMGMALLYASQELTILLPYQLLAGLVFFLTFVNVLGWWRTRWTIPVTEVEYFAHLVFDLIWLSLFLYWSGGASNPFVSYFLVPITIAAATLPWFYTGLLTVAAIIAYTLLLFFHVSIVELHPHHHGSAPQSPVNLHVVGMWLNFVVSALLISVFVVRMANALKDRNKKLAEKREEDLRNEQIIGLATFAAGTAHELGTPLNTITLLVKEMIADHGNGDSQLAKDLTLLESQSGHCKKILQSLVRAAEESRVGSAQTDSLDAFINELKNQWQLLRPGIGTSFNYLRTDQFPSVHLDLTLIQAIINLLNNAADVSNKVEVAIDWDEIYLIINIRDFGPGLPSEIIEDLGKPFVSTKGKGLGVGLFLTHATINRFGGDVELKNHPEQGAICRVRLKLQ